MSEPEGSAESRKLVLFVCTGNAARSQMAEGLLRRRFGARYRARSAGTRPAGLDPLAVAAMAEIGIDIAGQRSKSVEECLADESAVDIAVTVCDHARANCPYVPALERLHRQFEDPAAVQDPEARARAFREVRDQIETWIEVEFGES